MVVGWWVSNKNWILTDLISLSIIVASVKVFKFISLKMALFSFFITICVEVGTLIVIQKTKGTSYDDYLLNSINDPFQLQIPTLVPIIEQKCSWLAVSAIIYPGLLLSYLRRFDQSKNTRIYMITAGSTLFIGSLFWWLLNIFVPFSMPFGIISQPAMIITFCLFAFKRKELRTLWEGKFYDE